MTILQAYWYVPALILAEGVCILLMLARGRRLRADAARGIQRPTPEPIRGWRLVEVMILLYHFPIVFPTASIRKDQSVPPWVMFGFTPVVYSTVAFLIQRSA